MRRRQGSHSIRLIALAVSAFACFIFAVAVQAQQKTPQRATPAAPQKAPTRKAPADYFTRAKSYFAAGDYEKTLIFAAADLRANPSRKVSVLLMAQSYYRLGRPGPAAKTFLLLSTDDLTSDAAVDYTLSMFATKRFRQATKVWQKINPDHPYRDIARFYAGVSYMNLNMYSKASEVLRRAFKLPANLKSERRRLLGEIDQLLASQRQGQFGGGQAYTYQSQRYYQMPIAPPVEPTQGVPPPAGAPAPSQSPAPAAVAKKPPEPAKAGFAFSATPEVDYITKSTKKDFNGYSQVQESSKSPTVSVPIVAKYSGKPRSFGGQPTFTLKVTPGYEDIEGASSRSSLVAPESDPSSISTLTSSSSDHSFDATLTNSIDILYPMSEAIDIGVGYRDDHLYTNASQKLDENTTGPRAKLVIDGDTYKGELSFSMYEKSDTTDGRIRTTTTTSGTLTRNGETSVSKLMLEYLQKDQVSKRGEQTRMTVGLTWDKTWDDFSLGLLGEYIAKTAYAGTVIPDSPAYIDMNAARTQQNVGINGKWSIGFGLELTGNLKHSEFSEYEYSAKDASEATVIVPNSGSSNAFGFSGALSLGNYVTAEAAYNYTDRKISVGDAAYQEQVLKNACSQLSESSFKLGVKYPF